MRKVKDTTWQFTVKKEEGDGVTFDIVTKTIDGNYPDKDILDSIQIDDWVVTKMTLLDTNYE